MTILQNFNKISSKILNNWTTNRFKWHQYKFYELQAKSLWGYVAAAFNRVDVDRLNRVGPDRLCAEWIIKNGGAICTVHAPNHMLKEFNSLPPEQYRFKLKLINASESAIMKIGFDHFKGCYHIDTVILHLCKLLEGDGLQGLVHLRNTLKVLQVSSCNNITDDGLMSIGQLINLEMLKIYNMRNVKNMDNVKQKLSAMLPKCHLVLN